MQPVRQIVQLVEPFRSFIRKTKVVSSTVSEDSSHTFVSTIRPENKNCMRWVENIRVDVVHVGRA